MGSWGPQDATGLPRHCYHWVVEEERVARVPWALRGARTLLLCSPLVLGCFRDEMPEQSESDREWDSEEVRKQRKWLPEVAENCYDDIVGTWVGQSLLSSSWHHFTLDIERDSKDRDKIKGTIYTEVWTGQESDVEPPECINDGHVHYTLEQPAVGSYRDGVLTVSGKSVENKTKYCGSMHNYFEDTFTGEVSVGMNEFRVINDDGWNPPSKLLFRRIECDEKPAIFRTWPLSWVFD